MKCLDKKRIKMKQGETLALNERIMLSLVSTGVSVFSVFDVVVSFLLYLPLNHDHDSHNVTFYSKNFLFFYNFYLT